METKIGEIFRLSEISKFTSEVESLEDIVKSKYLYYELNDNWGKTWTGWFKKIPNKGTTMKLDDYKYHRFRYETYVEDAE